MFCEPRVAIDDVRLPEDGREILRGTANSCHSECLFVLIIWIIEVVLALAKVDDLYFVIWEEEKVCWFDVTVANALALQEGTSGYEAAVHCD